MSATNPVNRFHTTQENIKFTPDPVIAKLTETIEPILEQLNNDQEHTGFIHDVQLLLSAPNTEVAETRKEADKFPALAHARRTEYNKKTGTENKKAGTEFPELWEEHLYMADNGPITIAPEPITTEDEKEHIFSLRTHLIKILNAHPKVKKSVLLEKIESIPYFGNVSALMQIQARQDQILTDRAMLSDPSLGDGYLLNLAVEAYRLDETWYAKEIVRSIHTIGIRALTFFNTTQFLLNKGNANEAMTTADRAPFITPALRMNLRYKVLLSVVKTANEKNKAEIAETAQKAIVVIRSRQDKIACVKQVLAHVKKQQSGSCCFPTGKKHNDSNTLQLNLIEDLYETVSRQ